MSKYIYNSDDTNSHNWGGQIVQPETYHLIADSELKAMQNDETLLADLLTATAIMSTTNEVGGHITSGNDGINFLKDFDMKEVSVHDSPPFSSKTVDGLKLFTRATGKKHAVVVGLNTLTFSIPYDVMKFNGLEITNAKEGECVNLKVLDTPTGTLTGVPNYELNQFGFEVNLPDGFYSRESNYDADVIKDLQIRIEFEAIEARDLGVNYLIHELK